MEESFFIVVPSYALTKVSHRSAILLGTIISLARRTGECYASNAALCDMAITTPHALARDLKELEDNQLITREVVRNDRKEVVARYIRPTLSTIVQVPPLKSEGTLPLESASTPPHKTQGSNNISIDNIKDKNNYTNEFDMVWQSYTKVGSKYSAFKVWAKLSKEAKQQVANHVPKFVDQHQSAKKLEYLPHFTTYLNQRRWEDDALPYEKPTNSVQWA